MTPWTAAHQASLSFTISQSLLKIMPIERVIVSISSSVVPLFYFQFFPTSGSFPVSWLFAAGGQSCIGALASASASVLPMNIQGRFPLGLTGLTSSVSKGLSRVFSSTIIQKHQFFGSQPSFFMVQLSQPYMTIRKTIALTIQTFVGKVMSLLFMLSLS